MIRLVVVALLITACDDVVVHECTTGREGVEVAAAYAADHWPDVVDDASYLLVSCKPQDVIDSSISSCALALADRRESCAVHKAADGTRARIDVSHDEDAAISTCHELQHLRDPVWFTPDGCASHEQTCGYDVDGVARCEQAVRDFRGR